MKILRLPEVYHVGFLAKGPLRVYDADRRHPRSHEGRGLSVSLTPRAWTVIARLGGRPTWKLTHREGTPGQFAVWSNRLQGIANRWATREGVARLERAWRVHGTNEYGAPTYMDFAGHDEALEEAEATSGAGTVEPVTVLRLTDGGEYPHAEVLGSYVEAKHPDLDGVWWHHDYDPVPDEGYASVGVIRPHAIARWRADKSDYVEPEWEGR